VLFAAAIAGAGLPFMIVELLRRSCAIDPQPRAAGLFLAGAATGFVALVAEQLVWPYVAPLVPAAHVPFVRAFFVIAVIEETAKLGLIAGQLSQDEPADYRGFAILAAAVGAGFAGAENALYVFGHGPAVIVGRICTATPFHICNAIVASRLLWLGFRRNEPGYLAAALLVSVALHGLYDYSILTDTLGHGRFWFALAMTGGIALGLLRRPAGSAAKQ